MDRAPKLRTDRSADKMVPFAEGYGQTTLNNIATGSVPQFPPQVVEFTNSAAAMQAANFRTEDGIDRTIPVPAGQSRKATIPVVRLNTGGGANISAVAYWWSTPQLDETQGIFPVGGA
jgi:hypothetical protein